MANKDRQPVVQKAGPGPQRYQDSTNNSRVGKAPRVEVVPVDSDGLYSNPKDTGEIAPEAAWLKIEDD